MKKHLRQEVLQDSCQSARQTTGNIPVTKPMQAKSLLCRYVSSYKSVLKSVTNVKIKNMQNAASDRKRSSMRQRPQHSIATHSMQASDVVAREQKTNNRHSIAPLSSQQVAEIAARAPVESAAPLPLLRCSVHL